jgi:ornithine cyclodeaminase/alanine dehydrogenase-like protein (mu-crystallin family)
MAISVYWPTGVITVLQADLTPLGGSRYQLDVNDFRLALKDLEDSEDGQVWPTTHNHNTELTLSGVTYARSFEIINGYTVEFEDGIYSVTCVGANHNIADVKTVNSVSLIIGNSAGLIAVSASGATLGDIRTALLPDLDTINEGVQKASLMIPHSTDL